MCSALWSPQLLTARLHGARTGAVLLEPSYKKRVEKWVLTLLFPLALLSPLSQLNEVKTLLTEVSIYYSDAAYTVYCMYVTGTEFPVCVQLKQQAKQSAAVGLVSSRCVAVNIVSFFVPECLTATLPISIFSFARILFATQHRYQKLNQELYQGRVSSLGLGRSRSPHIHWDPV